MQEDSGDAIGYSVHTHGAAMLLIREDDAMRVVSPRPSLVDRYL